MYIDSPLWVLKRKYPYCKEGDPELYTCEECKTVVAICNEICFKCGALDKLRRAKDYEIISLLTKSAYE